ncbi:hypothetical protein KK120_08705 [Virgibacillus dakarensis]|nr:hypothetical protein [Virgibacillus dakarensis]MBT2215901.1 hypothetical protein [Virgibacillus dakarensis]
MNTVDIKQINNTVEAQLVPVNTVQYGLMGMQTYEGVEPIVDNKEG